MADTPHIISDDEDVDSTETSKESAASNDN